MAYGNKPYAGYGTAAASVPTTYSIAAVSPADAADINEVQPTFTVLPDSSDGSSMTIEWEWDTNSGFSNPSGKRQQKTTAGNADEVNALTQPDVGFGYHTYYWRARAGDGSTWSTYTTTRSFRVYPRQLSSSMYMEENIGFALPLIADTGDSSKYMEENIGFALPLIADTGNTSKYQDENIGYATPLIDDTGDSSKYMEMDSQDRPAGSETELPPTIN